MARLNRSGRALVASAVALGLAVAGCGAEPPATGWSVDPATLAADPVPGSLLRAEPIRSPLPDGVDGWRIAYGTVGLHGARRVATGVVLRPRTPAGTHLPEIAWAHGTLGVEARCSPSAAADPGLALGATDLLAAGLAQGWAVVATDYTAVGSPEPSPYLLGPEEGRAVLDAVRAARGLPGADPAPPVAAWGHSQGGHAALWAAAIAHDYAPDVDLVSATALAPAGDLPAVATGLESTPGGSLFLSYIVRSYAAALGLDSATLVRPGSAPVVDGLARSCLGGPEAATATETALALHDPVLRVPAATGPLADGLARNVPPAAPGVPVLIAQGTADPLVRADTQAAYVARLCAAGASLSYRTYPGVDHAGVVGSTSAAVGETIAFTGGHVARTAAAPRCPS